MGKVHTVLGAVAVFATVVVSACSGEESEGRGAGLEGTDGGGTGGSAGAAGTSGRGGGSAAAGSSGMGGSSGSAGAAGSGGTGNSSDGGACVWDGVSQRTTLDCIGDDYEYFGPRCRYTWHTCGPGEPGVVLPDVKFVMDCRVQNGSAMCDCLDRGKLVKAVSAPGNICWPQEAGVNQSPPLDEVYQPFLQLSASCSFCTYRPT
jgi:hypothetical protein